MRIHSKHTNDLQNDAPEKYCTFFRLKQSAPKS